MLLILKKNIFDLIIPEIFRYDSPNKCPTILATDAKSAIQFKTNKSFNSTLHMAMIMMASFLTLPVLQ